ncbi:MAG: DUF4339 domain-containing protein [Planctomycetaceae bacterium]|jgi:hypothetical protein|nr:DUF4339 domain-containing protein [Planctomycetaceae bacterium]
MANWYYYDNNTAEKKGPLTDRQLKVLAGNRTILRDTTIETENGKQVLAREISGLWTPDPKPPIIDPPSQVSGPFSSQNTFDSKPNVNSQQFGQAADKAYDVTRTFAENSTWKTALFRISQLLILVGCVLSTLYDLFKMMNRPSNDVMELAFEKFSKAPPGDFAAADKFIGKVQDWILYDPSFVIPVVIFVIVMSVALIAVLETAISTSKMVDYLRKE